MPDSSRDDLRRLHRIHALFAHLTGHDLYLARQIQEAIAFSLAELEARTRADPAGAAAYDAAFNAAAADLLAKLHAAEPRRGFYHWDAALSGFGASPLFTRAEVMEGLKQLARFRDATLLITNLRPALLPAGRRASPRRQREYAEVLDLIRDLAAARTARRSRLELLFL